MKRCMTFVNTFTHFPITAVQLIRYKKKTTQGWRGGLALELRTPSSERTGFNSHSGHRVVPLSKIHLPPKSSLLVIPRCDGSVPT